MMVLGHPLPRLALLTLAVVCGAFAQDDSTTQRAASGYGGSYITGPASNPLSFLNGPAYRTFASRAPYNFPDFAPANLLNRQLPGWIWFGWEERIRYEGYHNGGFKSNNDSYLLLRSRLQVSIRPLLWFRVVVQLQDSRPFMQKRPYGPPNLNAWDLKLAYVELGNPEQQWISVRVGRQVINYNNTVIATSEWRNQARSYDAAVVNIHAGRYRVGLFGASVVTPLAAGVSHHQQGNNIYGAYGGVDRLLPHSVLEPFVLWRMQPSVPVEALRATSGHQNEKAFGFRFKGIVGGSVDYSAEWVGERGGDGPNRINAWGTTVGLAYRLKDTRGKPRIFAQYDYATGDKTPNDGVHGTFDTMFPTSHDRLGIADLFGWQNIVAGRSGLTLEPRHRWTVTAQFLDFWLAQAKDGLYNSSGAQIVRDATGRSGTHVGEEIDAYTWYELNRHINIGVGVGHLMGARFLARTTTRPNYNYPYLAINFKDAGKQ